jgi:hypothetical protein
LIDVGFHALTDGRDALADRRVSGWLRRPKGRGEQPDKGCGETRGVIRILSGICRTNDSK